MRWYKGKLVGVMVGDYVTLWGRPCHAMAVSCIML